MAMRPRPPVWIVLANASHARVWAQRRPGEALALVREFFWPESAQKGKELVTDRPGRTEGGYPAPTQARVARKSRGVMVLQEHAAHTDPHHVQWAKFAHELARFLDLERARCSFRELVLALPPKMLGMVRGGLSEAARRRVSLAVSEDIVNLPAPLLAERLRELWAVAPRPFPGAANPMPDEVARQTSPLLRRMLPWRRGRGALVPR